jgi:hypothetical protein
MANATANVSIAAPANASFTVSVLLDDALSQLDPESITDNIDDVLPLFALGVHVLLAALGGLTFTALLRWQKVPHSLGQVS